MENDQRKILCWMRIGVLLLAALFATVCVAAFRLVPPALHALSHAEETLSDIDGLVSTADAALTAANAAASTANKVVADNADAVSDAMEKINSVDFDTLNRAINDLADIVEPLARVSNFFSR